MKALQQSFKSSTFLYCKVLSYIEYYSFTSPYKPVFINEEEVILICNPIRKVICAILHLYVAITYTNSLYKTFTGQKKSIQDNPRQLYDIAVSIGSAINLAVYLHLCWFKRKALQALYSVSLKSFLQKQVTPKEKRVLSIWILTLGVVFMFQIARPIINLKKEFHKLYTDDSHIFGTYGSYIETRLDGRIIFEYGLSFLVLLQFLYTSIIANITGLIVGYFPSVIVFKIGKECSEFLSDNPTLSISQVVKYYSEIDNLISCINQVFGPIMLGTTVSVTAYFSKNFIRILDPGPALNRFILCCYLTLYSSSFILAAHGAHNLEKLGEYIFDSRNRAGFKDNLDIPNIISELSSRPLGLKAFKFVITYGFIVQIFSTLLTYIIVLLQFGGIKNSNDNSTYTLKYGH